MQVLLLIMRDQALNSDDYDVKNRCKVNLHKEEIFNIFGIPKYLLHAKPKT